MLVKIPGTNLVRDTESMALINKDANGLEEYMMKRKLIQTQREQINNVMTEVDSVKEDIKEIKELLLKLMDKGSNG